MRLTLAIALALTLVTPALAYERPAAQSLNGDWDFCTAEPLIDIVEDRSAKPDFPQLSPEWDEVIDPKATPPWDAEWRPVQVPRAWEHYAGLDFNGAGWYARFLDVPPEWCGENQRIWLEFDAVATAAGVWANNEFIGAHVGDYSRWRVELTETIAQAMMADPVFAEEIPGVRAGPSVINPLAVLIAVYVDELPGHVTQGFPSMIGPHHGGIWQDVRMYCTGPMAIEPDGVHLEADARSRAVTATVMLDGEWPLDWPDPGFFVRTYDAAGEVDELYISHFDPSFTWEADATRRELTLRLKLPEAKRWSPSQPQMYEAVVELPDIYLGSQEWPSWEMVAVPFAFREVRIEGSEVLLNGGAIKLRSALNWGYYPGVIAPAPTPRQVRDEFACIKSLGFNAETVCLVNMPDYFYDIADEMGVLIWQEYPTWHNDFTAGHLPTYLREFTSFLHRDANHPCVVLRSISVEAGVEDQEVMGELVRLARALTDTPVQDNSSWFWLSNVDLTDWYGEDNYFNCSQWARHLLNTLPGQLGELPVKPYIIGESILANTWPDTAALLETEPLPTLAHVPASRDTEMAPFLGGASEWPYWFPLCFSSCLEIEQGLRARYNPGLPSGEDIVRDHLLPQSYDYALAFRRFQIELMHADPRYAGYTVNVVRDMPLIRAGLLDDLDRPRWTPAEWAWHGEQTEAPITAGQWAVVRDSEELPMEALSQWKREWDVEIDRDTPVLALRGGYRDLEPLLAQWTDVRWVDDHELSPAVANIHPALDRRVLVASVLTHNAVWHLQQGGAVVLLTSKWPGALGSYPHYFWRDAVFVPPVGPWGVEDCHRIVDLQMYDLNRDSAQVIPVDDLGLTEDVDPLLRLYDTHDRSTAVTYDQVFATRVSDGLLIATSLDHGTAAGQWVLGKLLAWAEFYVSDLETALRPLGEDAPPHGFPVTSLDPARLREFAVARPNSIISLDEDWRFRLDPGQVGESEGWMRPGYDVSGWDTVRAGAGWESLGYSYDGMAWYVREIEIPADWAGTQVRLVAEGIDDAYTVWLNGLKVATHGSFTVHEETVWLKQTVTDLTAHLVPGETNTLALQVVDIVGQGGIWRPVYLATE